jgi:hypothetical protein
MDPVIQSGIHHRQNPPDSTNTLWLACEGLRKNMEAFRGRIVRFNMNCPYLSCKDILKENSFCSITASTPEIIF